MKASKPSLTTLPNDHTGQSDRLCFSEGSFFTMKKCSKCGIEKTLDNFKKDPTKKDGHYSSCRDCCKLPPKPKRKLVIQEGFKFCNKCEQIKEFKYFHKDKSTKDGHAPSCAACRKKYNDENKDAKIEKNKKYYQENKERIDAKNLKWRKDNKEKSKIISLRYKQRHSERIKEMTKKYNDKNKEYKKDYARLRSHTDINFKILRLLRTRIYLSLKRNSKSATTKELLGCSIPELKNWLEMQFTEGMTWENHGKNGWHIDHIIPCDAFDLSDSKQQKVCFNYRNLQPLWESDNIRKLNRIPSHIKKIPKKFKK
jgi:hypothetical protein